MEPLCGPSSASPVLVRSGGSTDLLTIPDPGEPVDEVSREFALVDVLRSPRYRLPCQQVQICKGRHSP